MRNREIIRRLILNEVERMQPKVVSFEDDPINFILQKYPTLAETLKMLMSDAYKDYITGIYITAPKPTTFKIDLHNDQDFILTFMGKAYEASVSGKKFYLQTIGEKERCISAIARLLSTGNPIQTKGPEGEEQTSEPQAAEEETTAGEEEASETEA